MTLPGIPCSAGCLEDLAEEVRRLTERGIRFVHYPHLPQDAEGIWTGPGGTRVAWFRDPDGYVLSLTQEATDK